jgi:hypothetical protein
MGTLTMDDTQSSHQFQATASQDSTPRTSGARVLFIDDEAQIARAVRSGLALSGLSVECAVAYARWPVGPRCRPTPASAVCCHGAVLE